MRSRSRGNIIKELVRKGMDRHEAESRFGFIIGGEVWLPTSTTDDHYERVVFPRIEKRARYSPSAKGYHGLSGKFYVRNGFGKGDYAIACFDSEQHYKRLCPPKYISEERMMEDLDTVEYYEFKVKASGEERTYYTDTEGILVDEDSSMTEMIDLLYVIHGRDNVKFDYRKCITTSLSSLA